MSDRDARRWRGILVGILTVAGLTLAAPPVRAQGFGWGEAVKQFPPSESQSPVNTPNDFYHKIICTECHSGAPTRSHKRADVIEAPDFWRLHEDAKSIPDVAAKGKRYRRAKVRVSRRDPWRRYLDYLVRERTP